MHKPTALFKTELVNLLDQEQQACQLMSLTKNTVLCCFRHGRRQALTRISFHCDVLDDRSNPKSQWNTFAVTTINLASKSKTILT